MVHDTRSVYLGKAGIKPGGISHLPGMTCLRNEFAEMEGMLVMGGISRRFAI